MDQTIPPLYADRDELLAVTVEEAARRLSISRAKCYDLVSSGRLPSISVDRCRRVRLLDLRAWLAAQPTENDAA
jgi:excisionase family DNA binding protein